MGTYVKKGDRLRGNKIKCDARKISKIKKTKKSGRHNTQTVRLYDNVECKIEKEMLHYSENK